MKFALPFYFLKKGQKSIFWFSIFIAFIFLFLPFFLLEWFLKDYRLSFLFLITILFSILFAASFYRLFLKNSMPSTVNLPDLALLQAIIENDQEAIVINDRSGKIWAASSLYTQWFPTLGDPSEFAESPSEKALFEQALRQVWRNGISLFTWGRDTGDRYKISIQRAGIHNNYLIWRLIQDNTAKLSKNIQILIEGEISTSLAEAGIMTALLDAQGHILTASPILTFRQTGFPDGSIVGADFMSLFESDMNGQYFIKGAVENKSALRLVKVDLDRNNKTSDSLILMMDEISGALRNSKDILDVICSMLSILPYSLAITGQDGRLLFMNRAMVQTVSMSRQSVLYPSDWVVQEDKAAVADAVHRYGAGQPLSGEISVRLASKPEETIVLMLTGTRHLGGIAVVISLRESGAENQIKQQMAQATRMQAVGQLAGGVAHDFNNILTAIIGYCDVMRMRHVPGDSDYDDIQQIRHNSNRAAALTRQLLAFSRQQTMRPQILQLPDVISEISNLLKRLLGEKILLTVKHGRNLGLVRADPGQLEQVIVNLAVNARDAMMNSREQRHLTIQTQPISVEDVHKNTNHSIPDGEYTALIISDTGSGIPPEILSKIFEPFFTTKEVGKGTGLGLATVYGIVRQSGGFIFADSEMGVGTQFTIYLPVYEGVAPQKQIEVSVEKSALLWGSGKILLVEDEETVRNVAGFGLKRQGYDVLTAENGEEALSLLKDNSKIDLLISDVVMPGMDGPTLGSEARKLRPDLPVLFISGYAEEQLRRSISLEHVAFLPKPFSIQDLAIAVGKVLNAKE
ncbi:response regulator [Zymomonas mobilis]|uniref:histidine kinase n=1 Tax=Zymomonas mobilis subsp. pomaceae (strain ATCC 29192 / DSM 22645 / JCM 10191 / CCUG 17912 / NBRC 13757 / NCIMB 11200 / NRRL B-4491 / Barker I) TaxID=579138 RepID=F8ERR4_ZYMMT|nr:integral membrane sensor hybrid histidine kinase [Zymomonas mobilis subsp. pomaceae ATCC 29192]